MANLVSNSFLSITDLGGRIGRIRWRNTATTQFIRGSRFEFFGAVEWDDNWPPKPRTPLQREIARIAQLTAEINRNMALAYQALLPTVRQATEAIEQFGKAFRELQ